MNYYLRANMTCEVHGPVSLFDINEGLGRGDLTAEWLATADLDEGMERVKQLPSNQWTSLQRIPGTVVYRAVSLHENTPREKLSGGCRCLIWLVALLLVAYALLYAACAHTFGH
jgi:hypothetical protein